LKSSEERRTHERDRLDASMFIEQFFCALSMYSTFDVQTILTLSLVAPCTLSGNPFMSIVVFTRHVPNSVIFKSNRDRRKRTPLDVYELTGQCITGGKREREKEKRIFSALYA
jgi:hypothetical protein